MSPPSTSAWPRWFSVVLSAKAVYNYTLDRGIMRIFFPHPPGNPGEIHVLSVVFEFLAWLGAFTLLANALLWLWRMATQRDNFSYVPIKEAHLSAQETAVVDCTAPKGVPTLSHHKGHHNPSNLPSFAADTSTDIVLNAIKRSSYWVGGETYRYCQMPQVTTNHFDVDSFLSVWAYCNRQLALQHEPVLRHMSRIGDFREAFLSPELVTAFGAEDYITNIRQSFTALKLVCWLNTLEKRLFSASYESKDCDDKINFFLSKFSAVLEDPETSWADWQDEYTQVVGGFDELLHAAGNCSVETVKKIGLAVVQAHEPAHYYSVWSHTHGMDVVLSMYDGNRYEVECKYTQFIEFWSRGVWPRLDMAPLAEVLNMLEAPGSLPPGVTWTANKYTDTGPLLRLDDSNTPLTKAQRYGHPTDRPFISSSIPPTAMAALVQSFLEYGLQGLRPMRGGWTWEQLRDINLGINWHSWTEAVLTQHRSGELAGLVSDAGGELTSRLSHEERGTPMRPPPGPLQANMPLMSDGGSSVMSKEDVVCLLTSGALPARHRVSRWELCYCTQRDGISLHTLYRKAANKSPTVLIIKDAGGHIFGAYTPEAWHIGPRFYGTGETCVFKMRPTRLLYTWQKPRPGEHHNDFFQFSTHEGLGVGGVGQFAIWVDNDLFEGSSGQCDTFGSPCLASSTDFHVQALELWHLH